MEVLDGLFYLFEWCRGITIEAAMGEQCPRSDALVDGAEVFRGEGGKLTGCLDEVVVRYDLAVVGVIIKRA